MPQRTRSEEWMGADDPGYVRIPVLDGLMPFGHEEEPENDRREAEIRIPEGWETATSRSTGKVYFINTITGESQYEFPVGPARMYASESDVSDMEDSYGAQPAPAPAPKAASTEGASDDGAGDGSISDAAADGPAVASAGEASADDKAVGDPSAAAASDAAAELQRGATPAVAAPAPAHAHAAEPSHGSINAAGGSASTAAPEIKEEDPAEELPRQNQWECMPVRFYYEPGKTGFEASTEYAAVPDELIIGRYRIVKFLGEGAFSKAIQCIDTEGGSYPLSLPPSLPPSLPL
eukprot:COSAG03_NODE_6601_length_1033_cov_1.581370_1_plen_291_part_10